MTKDDIVITPTTDLFIASLWSAPKNEPILRSLLSGVMTDVGLPPIVKATVLNPFNIQEFSVDKQIRLDVRVEDELKTIYDIEVQKESHPDFFDRMLFYWADTYGSQLLRGEGYDALRPVRSIVITDFPVLPRLKRLHAVFKIRADENPEVLLSEHFQMHVLRLGDLVRNNLLELNQFCLDLQRWMQFWALGLTTEEKKMSTMLQDSPPVLAAYEEYKRFSADPAMREIVRERERFLNDQYLDRVYARKGKAIEVASNLKNMGLSLSDIAKATGLSLSEVERLD